MKERVLWAVKIGAEDWEEQLIVSTSNIKHLEKAAAWAVAHGFDRLRESVFVEGEKPDFTKVVR